MQGWTAGGGVLTQQCLASAWGATQQHTRRGLSIQPGVPPGIPQASHHFQQLFPGCVNTSYVCKGDGCTLAVALFLWPAHQSWSKSSSVTVGSTTVETL